MTTTIHASGLFSYTGTTTDAQGDHYMGGILLQDTDGLKAGTSLTWVTHISGLLLAWIGNKVVLDVVLPTRIHASHVQANIKSEKEIILL